jgi:YD repeat-containing protein
MIRAAWLAALLLATAACIPEPGPMMLPYSDCMECHAGGDAPHWTVAGTWDRRGQQVGITDANGKTFTRHTNLAGNFWTSEPVTFPLRVSVDGVAMSDLVQASSRGSCNLAACHPHGSGN